MTEHYEDTEENKHRVLKNSQVLGFIAADDAAKAKAASAAGIASRLNTLLSIPMLLCMTNAH